MHGMQFRINNYQNKILFHSSGFYQFSFNNPSIFRCTDRDTSIESDFLFWSILSDDWFVKCRHLKWLFDLVSIHYSSIIRLFSVYSYFIIFDQFWKFGEDGFIVRYNIFIIITMTSNDTISWHTYFGCTRIEIESGKKIFVSIDIVSF